jgi:hypothetical protein
VTSVGLSAPTGFSVAGSPITGSGTLALSFAAGYSLPTTAKQGEWDQSFSERLRWDGGSTGLDATTARASLGLGDAATRNVGTASGTVAAGNDARLSDSRTPTAHKASHATGGTDALTPADIGAATAAQGALASTAVQPEQLATVATTGAYGDLSGLPTLPGVVTTSSAGLQLATGYGSIAYAAQVTLDFAALNGQMNFITLTGALELLATNLANGRELQLRLIPGASQRTLTFPVDWVFYSPKPANIPANKELILSLAAYGATNAAVRAIALTQP